MALTTADQLLSVMNVALPWRSPAIVPAATTDVLHHLALAHYFRAYDPSEFERAFKETDHTSGFDSGAGNELSIDGTYAQVTTTDTVNTYKWINEGRIIPAIPTGFQIRVVGKSANNDTFITIISVEKNGSQVYFDSDAFGTWSLGTTDTTITFGDSTELFGTTWTVSDEFAVELGIYIGPNGSDTLYLDGVELTTWYDDGTTFTAALSATIGATTAALSATFAPGTKTATLAATIAPATAALSASHTPPTYTATIGATVAPTTAALSATFTAPTYTASITATAGAVTADLAATFTAPVYTADIAATTGAITAALSATFTAPIYTAAMAASVAPATASFAAEHTPPSYTATLDATVGATTADMAAIFATVVYQASMAASVGATTAAMSASHTPPTYTADLAAQTGPATASMTATFTPPSYTATIAIVVGAALAEFDATFAPGTKIATMAAVMGAVAGSWVASFVASVGTEAGELLFTTYVTPSIRSQADLLPSLAADARLKSSIEGRVT